MSIISQAGVVLLIVLIVVILVKANKTLSQVEKEGEHFVDEWALREEKKVMISSTKHRDRNDNSYKDQDKGSFDDSYDDQNIDSYNGLYDAPYDDQNIDSYNDSYQGPRQEQNEEFLFERNNDKIIPIKKKITTGICLYVTQETDNTRKKYEVDRIPFYIGRDGKNDLVLDDITVAKVHCFISKTEEGYELVDNNSINKIQIDGRSTSRVTLSDHLVFQLGSVDIQVSKSVGGMQYGENCE